MGYTQEVQNVALALAKARGFRFLMRETTLDDIEITFGPQIFAEATAAIEAMNRTRPIDSSIPRPIGSMTYIVEKGAGLFS